MFVNLTLPPSPPGPLPPLDESVEEESEEEEGDGSIEASEEDEEDATQPEVTDRKDAQPPGTSDAAISSTTTSTTPTPATPHEPQKLVLPDKSQPHPLPIKAPFDEELDEKLFLILQNAVRETYFQFRDILGTRHVIQFFINLSIYAIIIN